MSGQRHDPAALPPGKTRYPLYRRLGGSQGRSGEVRKIWPPLGFDPRTVQPVASRYTDYSTRPNCYHGKAMDITYSQCVSVDLVTQDAKRMHRIILSCVPYYIVMCTVLYSHVYRIILSCVPHYIVMCTVLYCHVYRITWGPR